MNGISTTAKIERGEDDLTQIRNAEGESYGLIRAFHAGAVPGKSPSAVAWKGQYRFRKGASRDWMTVVNSQQLHILYMTPEAAIAAAKFIRSERMKIQS